MYTYSDPLYRKSFIALLIHTAKADNENHVNEIRFIREVAIGLGLTEEDVIDIRSDLSSFLDRLPTIEEDRMMLFMHCMHLIKIDNEITEEEKNTIRNISLRLGINLQLTEEMLYLFEQEIKTGTILSSEDVVGLIRKYLN